MSLFRKPKVGEQLVTNTGVRYTVTHFGGDGDRICFIEGERGATCFIWAFFDGSLNEWFSVAPVPLESPLARAFFGVDPAVRK